MQIQKHTRLDDIPERSAELGLLRLELVDDLLREVLLEQRFAIGGLQFGVSVFDLLDCGGLVRHVAGKEPEQPRYDVEE